MKSRNIGWSKTLVTFSVIGIIVVLPGCRASGDRASVPAETTAALHGERGRQEMDLFAKVAHEQGERVIIVTHDHRSLDVFDTIYEMEDGLMQRSEKS